jgi:hypothetical protein
MHAFYTLIITRLIAWLHGLSRSDFDQAIQEVRHWATRNDLSGYDKAKYVGAALHDWFQANGREIGSAALNVLIELAVSYTRRVK